VTKVPKLVVTLSMGLSLRRKLIAQYPLHKALDKIRPLLRAVHRNPAVNTMEIAMRPPKQGILNVTLLILKLTLSEPRETISSLIHAL
jgi:hypothetical protein